MSSRVRASAVAVTARRGTSGNSSASRPSIRYSGRKSWPHWLTQWASSMAISASGDARSRSQHRRAASAPRARRRAGPARRRRSAARSRPRSSGVDVGVQPGGRDARLLQRRDLVGHQGDQRRDHQAEARPQHGGDLVAEALAAAGRQHGQARCARPAPRRSRRPAGRGSRRGRTSGAGCRGRRRGSRGRGIEDQAHRPCVTAREGLVRGRMAATMSRASAGGRHGSQTVRGRAGARSRLRPGPPGRRSPPSRRSGSRSSPKATGPT